MIRSAEVWAKDETTDGLNCTTRFDRALSDQARELLTQRVREELGPVLQLPGAVDASTDGTPSLDGEALLGIPVVNNDDLRAILMLDLVCDTTAPGAIEVWSRDERDELGLNGAIFSALNRFANISQFVRFPRGSGLPGMCWEDRQVKLVHQLGKSPGFMRAAGARAGGLDVGIAVPVMKSEHNLHSVLLMLSSAQVPIARSFEVWNVDDTQTTLTLSSSSDDAESVPELEYAMGEGLVGMACELGIPVVSNELDTIDPKRTDGFRNIGISRAIALPVYIGQQIRSVLLMLD